MLQNKYKIQGQKAYLFLTKGQVSLVDVDDLERILKYKWHVSPIAITRKIRTYGDKFYAISSIDGKTTYLHRFVMDAKKGKYIDHINFNTLDNRKENLRICTNQQNTARREKSYSTSKLNIRGVSIHKKASGKIPFLYVFRCHCITCKIAKYFTYTDEGLNNAKKYAEEHYRKNKILNTFMVSTTG